MISQTLTPVFLVHLHSHVLPDLGDALKGLDPERRVVQPPALWDREWAADRLQDPEQASEALGITDSFVHAVAHR